MTDNEMNYLMYKKSGLSPLTDWDWYTCDMDTSGTFTWDDIYEGYNTWGGSLYYTSFIFTPLEKTTIESNPNINYFNTYPLQQQRTETNINQFYIMSLGKHKTTTTSNKIE